MKSRSLARLALSAAVTLMLTTSCSPRFVQPTPDLPIRPQECVRTCPPIPEPADRGEAAYMRWEQQLVHWGERCAVLARDCAEASK